MYLLLLKIGDSTILKLHGEESLRKVIHLSKALSEFIEEFNHRFVEFSMH